MILNMPRRKHKHETLRASRLSDGDAEHSFVSVTYETQNISATLCRWKAWSVPSITAAQRHGTSVMRALAAREHSDG